MEISNINEQFEWKKYKYIVFYDELSLVFILFYLLDSFCTVVQSN